MPTTRSMGTKKDVDLVAVARVAKCVDLQGVRLSELTATASQRGPGELEPSVEHECVLSRRDERSIDVTCSYRFVAWIAEAQIAEAQIKYLLSYRLEAEGAEFSEADVEQFAFANGTYHSWPFVRELLFDLTSRWGYPQFTLPVFVFNPKPRPKPTEQSQAEQSQKEMPEAKSSSPDEPAEKG